MAVHDDLQLADLVRYMHQQPAGANVVDLVWLGREALADLDAQVAQFEKVRRPIAFRRSNTARS